MKKIIIILVILVVIQCLTNIVKGSINIVNNNDTIREINKLEKMDI